MTPSPAMLCKFRFLILISTLILVECYISGQLLSVFYWVLYALRTMHYFSLESVAYLNWSPGKYFWKNRHFFYRNLLTHSNFFKKYFKTGISLDYGEARPNFVRGFNHPCGWFCIPLKDNPGHSLLIGFIQTDLRGKLPQSAVDTAMAGTLISFYSDLRKALKA